MLCFSTLSKLCVRPATFYPFRNLHVTQINPAARKGTREKARKKKIKVEVKKVGFIPHNQRGRDKLNLLQINKHIDDSWKAVSTDDVWIGRYYRWRVYTVQEAIKCHKETHHPTMYGIPDAPLNVTIELNTQGEKITRFVDNFQRMALIPHKFDHGEERQIMVLTKGEDNCRQAIDAGAILAGGTDIIRDIQNGDLKLNDYQYVIAHPNIMPELISIRGLMKRKFPNPKSGTLGVNLAEIVQQHVNGIQYNAKKDENQNNFGLINTCIGKLNMDSAHLEENLVSLLNDINKMRPKREGTFITRVILSSPPSGETLKIDPFLYIPEENLKQTQATEESKPADEQEEEEIQSTATASN